MADYLDLIAEMMELGFSEAAAYAWAYDQALAGGLFHSEWDEVDKTVKM